MKVKSTLLLRILQSLIVFGVLLALINFFNGRSLWVDEAMLALNIVDRDLTELLLPLNHRQVAPIGFLMVEKLMTSMFGNSDWSLRIFPFISFVISIFLMYSLTYKVLKEKVLALFSSAFFSLSYSFILYSAEVKQYMSDVLFCLLILQAAIIYYEKSDRKNLMIYSFLAVISVWFSNVSIVLLVSTSMFLSYGIYKNNGKFLDLVKLVFPWILTFVLYYYKFIIGHLTKDFMMKYWSDLGAFLPRNILSYEFYVSLSDKIQSLITSFLWQDLFLIEYAFGFIAIAFGFIFFAKKKKEILFLLIFPIALHLLLSYLKLYPFHERLTLYLFPSLIILFTSGIYYLLSFFKTNNQWHYYFLILPLIFNLIVINKMGFPIEKEELKKALNYVEANISKDDKLYVSYGASPAFLFYKNDYISVSNESANNIVYGKANRDNWAKYEKQITELTGTVWILFSHVYWVEDKNGHNEESYIIDLFIKNDFKIIEKHEYYGSSIYKAVRQ